MTITSSRPITSSLPLPPGDGERFSDPAANPVYAATCSLDVASQHDVLRLLHEKLYAEDISSESGEATRRARAITALNEARAELGGKSPSVDEYRRLYGERRAAGIWPDDRCVRRWLGAKSWNGALRCAHPVPDGDVTVFQHGPRSRTRSPWNQCASARPSPGTHRPGPSTSPG